MYQGSPRYLVGSVLIILLVFCVVFCRSLFVFSGVRVTRSLVFCVVLYQYSFGFPRGAPYRDDINRALLILKENGRLDKLKAKYVET